MAQNKKNLATQNFEDLIGIVESIEFKRNPEKLLEFLTEGDFFICPGSVNHHGNFQGGLYQHCKSVYKVLSHLNKLLDQKDRFSDETIFYTAFCHDLCKIGNYHIIKKWKKDEHNQWQSYDGYQEVDEFPCGHATKSIILAMPLVELTKEEMVAIRYHMGSFMETDYYSGRIYDDARRYSKLTTLLQSADIISSDCFEIVLKH